MPLDSLCRVNFGIYKILLHIYIYYTRREYTLVWYTCNRNDIKEILMIKIILIVIVIIKQLPFVVYLVVYALNITLYVKLRMVHFKYISFFFPSFLSYKNFQTSLKH